MARDFTNHQRKIVNRYYEHRETIMTGKLQEIVSELYLAETDKKREKLWERAEKALAATPANPARVKKVLAERNVEEFARLVAELA